MASLFRDSRREAERQRLAELESIMAAIDKSRAAIEFDTRGNILTANANFLQIMGYSLEELRGKHHRMFVDPEFARSTEYEQFWRTLGEGTYRSDKFRRLAKGGREVWIQAAYNPVMRDGSVYKIVKFATDVTEVEHERARNLEERARAEALQSEVVSALARSLHRLAAGDLGATIAAEFDGRYRPVRDDFNAALAGLSQAMAAITVATGGVSTNAEDIARASDDLSRRTEQQAASLEETAAALDQLTATVKRSSERAGQAAAVASDARKDASVSGRRMEEAVAAMREIQESSTKITQIIGVIDEIAFQTNLLALNAGVEAARAGEAGRGFAVVATEVRALAQRSATAAKEIKTLIDSSASQVAHGVEVVGDTGRALSGIVVKVGDIDGIITEIAQSSREQAVALQEVNTAVNQMDHVTQQNAAMVEQATATASTLQSEAAELEQLVRAFRLPASSAPHRAEPSRPRTLALVNAHPVRQAHARIAAARLS